MQISSRELQIIKILMQGKTNKEIGQALDLSPHTVRDYISALLQRSGVDSRAALALLCAKQLEDPRAADRSNDRRVGPERRLAPRSPMLAVARP